MPPPSFKHFPELPAELRILIWEAALAAPSVWAAAPGPLPSGVTGGSYPNPRARAHAYTMGFVGPAPYMAGLACKEAWALMKRSYGRPVRGPAGAPHVTQLSWVDMDHTVVHVGDADTMVLPAFDPETWFKIKHVALTWRLSHYYLISSACLRLSEVCPLLRTLIIQTRENVDEASPPLSVERAADYAGILAYNGPPLECEEMDMAKFWAILKYDLPDPPPRVHVLGPGRLPAIPG